MKKYLLVLLCIVFLIFTGCEKGKLVGEYFLKEGSKEVIPYKGNDVVKFRNNNIDTLLFTGSERIDEMRDSYVSVSSDDYNLWEYNQINFTNDVNLLKLMLEPSVTNDSTDNMSILYEYIEGNYYHFNCRFSIWNGIIQSQLYDSIFINQKNYYNVYYDTMEYLQNTIPQELLNYPTKLYYSTQYGILKIDFADGTTWELESVNFGGE